MTGRADERSRRGEAKTPAGVAGVGTGTALVGLAQLAPEGHWLRVALPLLAPFVSVVVNGVCLWAFSELGTWMTRRKLNAAAARSRAHAEEVLSRPDITPEFREKVLSTKEQIELGVIEHELNLVRSLAVVAAAAKKTRAPAAAAAKKQQQGQ